MKTFPKGGVHPEENKFAASVPITDFPLPKQGVVFVSQHLGQPSTPVVSVGDKVKVGQLLAKAEGFICSNTHSPYSGTIKKIDLAKDTNGYSKPAIYIDVEGDQWDESIDRSNTIKKEITLSKEEIIQRMKDMGVVGLGGASFPTQVKYMISPDKHPDFLIVNGVECEPYLTSDYRLMLECGEELMVGIEIAKKAMGVSIAKIGIENNKPDAIAYLQKLASNYPGTEIHPLKVKYPQGAEKQLIKALTGREVPSGKLPIEVGCVVNNVGSIYAIYEAVQKNKPVIENVLTISGKSVKTPKNLRVRVGTMISDIINEAIGGLPEDTGKVINGGPMMGKAMTTLDAPTSKATSSILIMTEKEAKRNPETACIRCGKCVSACPMGLEPYLLQSYIDKEMWEDTEKNCVMDCIECGSCLFSCPANKPLLDSLRVGKSKVGAIRRARTQK